LHIYVKIFISYSPVLLLIFARLRVRLAGGYCLHGVALWVCRWVCLSVFTPPRVQIVSPRIENLSELQILNQTDAELQVVH